MSASPLVNVTPPPSPLMRITSALRSVPGQLWLRQALIAALTAAVTVTGFFSYRAFAQLTQTLGHDAVPSIVAAERIRTRLADAHTQLMNVFLTRDAEGPAMQAYVKSIALAHDHLLAAAQNITYGDDERVPILAVMTQLSEYERRVGQALAVMDYSDTLGKADQLMRDNILPAVTALDRANFDHLGVTWDVEKTQSRAWLAGFVVAAVLLVAVLLETQWRLYVTFRRIINPALALALVWVSGAAFAFVFIASQAIDDLRSAKEDAFDSVHALSQAEAMAYVANAHESIYLLLHGRGEQTAQAGMFSAAAARMFSGQLSPERGLPANLKTFKGQGFLGDELANITYEGEAQLATTELKHWLVYLQIDAQIRELEAAGQHTRAVALCLGTQPQQSDWAFERFVGALRATLQLNENQFNAAIARAVFDTQLLGTLLLVLLLAPPLGSLVGLRARLAEFRE